jgi:hypothetical protein
LPPTLRERVAAWCDWAEESRYRNDPTVTVDRIRVFEDERDRFFVHRFTHYRYSRAR